MPGFSFGSRMLQSRDLDLSHPGAEQRYMKVFTLKAQRAITFPTLNMATLNFLSVHCILTLILSLGIIHESSAFLTTPSFGKFSVVAANLNAGKSTVYAATADDDIEDDDLLDMAAFAARRDQVSQQPDPLEEFDGYAFRDLLLAKWGECYDVDFNRVDSFGFREIYLNIYPFKMGGRNKWRHESELDYLCHLQAIVEILEKYEQLDKVIFQIQETSKKPKMGAPIKAVPIRLDLTKDEVNKIMGRWS